MTRLLAILLAAVLALAPLAGQAQSDGEAGTSFPETPGLLVNFDPPGAAADGLWVQGQLRVRVQIPSRYPFDALDLDLPEIENAKVLTLVKPRTRRQRSYAGDGYVLETILAIFPTRSGTLVIPEIRASGKATSPGGDAFPFDNRTEPVTIPVRPADPGWEDPWWLVAERIEIEEHWSQPLDQIRSGDVVTRTVVLTAFGATAEQLPDLEHGRTRGLQATEVTQKATTRRTASGAVGTLEKSWELKFSQDPVVYISPVGVAYWHPGAGERRKASVPGVRIEPLPEDAVAIAARLMTEAEVRYRLDRTLIVILLGVLAVPLVVIAAVVVWRALPTHEDRVLAQRCRAGCSAAEFYRAVLHWAREEGFDPDRDRHELPDELSALEAHLFGLHDDPGGLDRLAEALRKAGQRRRLRGLRARALGIVRDIIGPRITLDAHRQP